MSERNIVIQAYIWFSTPILLFLGNWFRPEIGLPVVALILWCLYRILIKGRNELHTEGYSNNNDRKQLIWLGIAVLAYVIISGIGGVMAQVKWDHAYRNAVFFDLSRRDWPVVFEGEPDVKILCYYFVFWLPPALVSKATGSILAGDLAQILWASWATWISINLIVSSCSNKKGWAVLATFILFNAWDIITCLIFGDPNANPFLKDNPYRMLWCSTASDHFAASANQIFFNYIYNQGIPAWLMISLLLHERKHTGRLLFIYSLLPAFAPIPSVALAPYIAWRCLREIKKTLTIENITGLLSLLLIFFFMTQNNSASRFMPVGSITEVIARWGESTLYYSISFGVFIPFFWKEVRHSVLYWSTIAMSVLMAGFSFGDTSDLAWRISVPSVILTNYMMCRRATEFRNMSSRVKAAFVAVMIIACPSSLYMSVHVINAEIESARGERERKLLRYMGALHHKDTFYYYNNFISDGPSFYRRWLMPRNVTVQSDLEITGQPYPPAKSKQTEKQVGKATPSD